MKNEPGPLLSKHASRRLQIGLWIVPLDAFSASSHRLTHCLPPGQQARCDRIMDPVARRRSRIAHAALRHILAHVLKADPVELAITRGERGKPRLQSGDGYDFSLSHSRDIALVAVAPTAVGVDVEHDRAGLRVLATARRILHADTTALLEQLEGEPLTAAFLDAWTLREAHVKAVGGGLFHTPDALPFDPAVAQDGSVVTIMERDSDRTWSVARLRPTTDSHAAVVAAGIVDAVHVRNADATIKLLEDSI
jgi:4'-phosphopantetheinyl transferase